MFCRRKNVKLIHNSYSIYLIFVVFGFSNAAPQYKSERDVDGERVSLAVDTMNSIMNEINDLREAILVEKERLRGAKAVVETMCHDFEYPVKTILELTDRELTIGADPFTRRFRRDDKTTMTQSSAGSSKDYMSIYYAQRKAIIEKYKSQRKEIMERLKKTKSLIAETKKLKESKKTDSGTASNVTVDKPRDSDALETNVTSYVDRDSTVLQNFNQTTNDPLPEVLALNSTSFNDTQIPDSNGTNSPNSSEEEAEDYSSELVDIPNATSSSPIGGTLGPLDGADAEDKTEAINRPDLQTLDEGDWPINESVNLIPRNDVDFNLTEKSFVRQERDNDTVAFSLGGHAVSPSIKNDSAFDQLEKMFLWEVEVGDERVITPSNETGPDSTVEKLIDSRSYNSSQSSDSLRFMVEIKSSPEVHVTKNIKNVRTSTTTYRNSTHEIVQINGVVNSTKRIDGLSSDVADLQPYLKNVNSTNRNVTAAEIGGGATESEWCEECPHDYRWGDCDGTLFYQHNIFLRNRGPSAIDAIFGMNVQGPVSITCVEAIRFNQTRGLVTLNSGGPGHDYAKLRIRGFQGEGFSYIMKVWGVTSEEFVDDASYSY